MENMKKLSLYERPIHCTDTKRETLYIKSDDPGSTNSSWKKDNEHEELNLALRKLSHKQIQSICFSKCFFILFWISPPLEEWIP